MIIYDLDGTLVDTRNAIYAAYAWVGVRMPKNAWGRPWTEWLKNEELHRQKNEVYPRFLRTLGKRLPLMEIALKTHAPVITGASPSAVSAIRTAFGAQALNVVMMQATMWDKIDYLKKLKGEPGTYVDDDGDTRREVKRRTQWDVATPMACLLSFSRRAPTKG